jgi:hypothetical protein
MRNQTMRQIINQQHKPEKTRRNCAQLEDKQLHTISYWCYKFIESHLMVLYT